MPRKASGRLTAQSSSASKVDPPLTQKGLSELLLPDPSDAVRLLDELEELRLIQRLPDAADRRRKLLVLTVAGRSQTERCRQVIADAEEDLLGALDPGEREMLRRLLKKVISAVGSRIRLDEAAAELEESGVR